MGGLIARDYIRNSEHAKKVKTLVELGTPHAGTPTFLAHLLYNKCVKVFGILCIVNGNEVNKLVQNWPGAFELMPSRLYYQLYPDRKYYPFKDSRDIDGNGIKDELNYDQLKTLLSNIHVPLDLPIGVTSNISVNMPLFNIAEAYHDALDESYHASDPLETNTNGVETYLIAGSGQPTL